MADREIFQGFALQAVDPKGRVAIPADLRVAAERNSEERLIVIGMHPKGGRLSAHDVAWSKLRYARIDRREQLAEEGGAEIDSEAKNRAFGRVERAPYDDSGRFVIPLYFKTKADIGKWAFFSGSGDTFEIWAPGKLLADEDADPELKEICEFLCAQKGVKL